MNEETLQQISEFVEQITSMRKDLVNLYEQARLIDQNFAWSTNTRMVSIQRSLDALEKAARLYSTGQGGVFQQQ